MDKSGALHLSTAPCWACQAEPDPSPNNEATLGLGGESCAPTRSGSPLVAQAWRDHWKQCWLPLPPVRRVRARPTPLTHSSSHICCPCVTPEGVNLPSFKHNCTIECVMQPNNFLCLGGLVEAIAFVRILIQQIHRVLLCLWKGRCRRVRASSGNAWRPQLLGVAGGCCRSGSCPCMLFPSLAPVRQFYHNAPPPLGGMTAPSLTCLPWLACNVCVWRLGFVTQLSRCCL